MFAKTKLRIALVVFCAVGLILAGCSRSAPSAVRGQVLLDGQPLANASVQLIPDSPNPLGMHSATTDGSGHFRFAESGSSNNPIQPGSYVVLVSKVTNSPAPENLPGGGMGASVETVPIIYQDRTKSPLKAEISSANTELPPLQLKSAGM